MMTKSTVVRMRSNFTSQPSTKTGASPRVAGKSKPVRASAPPDTDTAMPGEMPPPPAPPAPPVPVPVPAPAPAEPVVAPAAPDEGDAGDDESEQAASATEAERTMLPKA